MAADAAAIFARLQINDTAHRLNGAPLFVYRLEVDGQVRWNGEMSASVFFNRNGTKNRASVCRARKSDSWRIASIVGRLGKELNYTQFFNCTTFREGLETFVNIGKNESSGRRICRVRIDRR